MRCFICNKRIETTTAPYRCYTHNLDFCCEPCRKVHNDNEHKGWTE